MSNRSIFLKNFYANLLLQITTVVSGLVLPPLIILHYGSAANGMLASAKQLIAYLDILEAGIGASSIALLYKPLFEKDTFRRNQILATTHRFYRLIGLAFFAFLIILALAYSYLIRQQIPYTETFFVILFLGMVNALDFLTIASYRVLLLADNKTAVISSIQAVITLLNVLACWQLIQHDTGNTGLIDLQVAYFSVSLLRFLCIYLYVKKQYPDLSLHSSHAVSLSEIPQKRDAFIIKSTALLNYIAPMILTAIFCNLKDTSIYSIYFLIFGSIKLTLHTVSNGTSNIFGKILTDSSQKERIDSYFQKYESMYFIYAGFLYSCISVLALPFISIYTKTMTDADYYQPILMWLFVIAGFGDLKTPYDLLCTAAGKFKPNRTRGIIELSLHISSSVILANHYGLHGILLGSILSSSYNTISSINYTNKHLLHRSTSQSIKKILLISSPILISFYIQNYLTKTNIQTSNYINWLTIAIPTGITFSLTYLIIYKIINRKNWQHNT